MTSGQKMVNRISQLKPEGGWQHFKELNYVCNVNALIFTYKMLKLLKSHACVKFI